jgi:hypothetical protein
MGYIQINIPEILMYLYLMLIFEDVLYHINLVKSSLMAIKISIIDYDLRDNNQMEVDNFVEEAIPSKPRQKLHITVFKHFPIK